MHYGILEEVVARTGVYRVSALARVRRRRHEVFPPYLLEKVMWTQGPSAGTVKAQVSRVYYGTASKKGLQWLILIYKHFYIVLKSTTGKQASIL